MHNLIRSSHLHNEELATLITALVERGADPNVPTYTGETPAKLCMLRLKPLKALHDAGVDLTNYFDLMLEYLADAWCYPVWNAVSVGKYLLKKGYVSIDRVMSVASAASTARDARRCLWVKDLAAQIEAAAAADLAAQIEGAAVIQRWWMSRATSPYTKVGQRVQRRRFEMLPSLAR